VIWVSFGLRTLLLLGWIGVGVTVVRQAHARSGYLLAAAGGVALLASCCVRGVYAAVDYTYANMMMFHALSVLGALADALSVGLALGALLGLAKEITARKKAAAAPPGPPVAF
jgi:hypothetical protein